MTKKLHRKGRRKGSQGAVEERQADSPLTTVVESQK
jgi:hypothetical protein